MRRLDLFPTPVTVFDLPGREERDRELCACLLAEEARVPSLQVSNYGGWHSRRDLHERPDTAWRELMQTLRACTRRVVSALAAPGQAADAVDVRVVHAWAMIMRAGDYTILHDHGEADWSCVYYPDVGDPATEGDAGALALNDPRHGVRRPLPDLDLYPATFALAPRRGTLVVFPGWLQHQVLTYTGQRPRISVAANLVMER
jgi:uncharacterized protein (TIGR02466 family)